jgi:hypothetical protein
MADYATFEQIVDRLGGQATETHRTFIESKIVAASRAIDERCGQEFTPAASAATVRYYRPRDAYTAKVDPFHTTTGLVVETDDTDTGVYVTWTAADYALRRFGGNRAGRLAAPYDTLVAVGGYRFPVTNLRPDPVKVTAKWGWTATPSAVTEACEILTVELWARREAPFGIQQTVEFGPSWRIGRDVYAQVSDLLRPFERLDITAGFA